MRHLPTKLAIAAIAGSMSMLTLAEHHMDESHTGMDKSGMEKEQQNFSAMDKDGNGSLSEMEAQADPKLTEHWDDVDSDSDKAISESEFSKFEAKEMSGDDGMQGGMKDSMDKGMEGGMDTGREGPADPDRLGSEANTMDGEPEPMQQ